MQAHKLKARVTVGRPDPEDPILAAVVHSIAADRVLAIDGYAWTVRELVDPVTHRQTLVFFGHNAARRVRHYPTNWESLTDRELFALSWGH